MSIDEQVEYLNRTITCFLAPSKIHGIGVFALRDIKDREKLYCQEYERQPFKIPFDRMKKEVNAWELIQSYHPTITVGGHFMSPSEATLLVSYINFSENPNYHRALDIALRDIKKGEEITEDYGEYTYLLKK